RRVDLSEFDVDRDTSAARMIERFTADRLLTVSGPTVEVAHEALLREWPRLRDWLDEDVQGRQLRQHLTESAKTWQAQGQEGSDVYRGARLSAALEWSGQHGSDLNDLERSFLNASREVADDEAEQARRTNRRLRTLLVGAVVLLLVASAAGIVALAQRSTARHQSTVARADALGAQAVSQTRLDKAMLLANQGVTLNANPQTRSDLLATLLRAPSLIRTYHVNLNRLNGIDVSRDGKLLALADNDGHVAIVSAASGARLKYVSDVPGNAAQLTRDDRLLRYVSNQKSTGGLGCGDTAIGFQVISARPDVPDTLWRFPSATARVATPKNPAPIGGSNLRCTWQAGATFTPDGRIAAVPMYSRDPSKRDYVFQIGYPSGRLAGPTIRLGSAQPSSPDLPGPTYVDGGRTLVLTDSHGTYFYDARSGRLLRHLALAGFGAISPDGSLVASSTPRGDLTFTDLKSGKTTAAAGSIPGGANSMRFTPDGSELITGAQRGAVQIWDVASHALVRTLPASAENVVGVVLSPSGDTLYAASFDRTANAWSLSGEAGSVPAFQAIQTDYTSNDAWSLEMSPDGRWLAIGSTTGEVGFVDTTTLRTVRTFKAAPATIAALSWSPNGRSLLVVADGCPSKPPYPQHDIEVSCARIWHVAGAGAPTAGPMLASPFEAASYATFTHDNRYVVVSGVQHASGDQLRDPDLKVGSVGIWNAGDGSLAAPVTQLSKGTPNFVAASPIDDEVGASGNDGSFELVDPLHQRVVHDNGTSGTGNFDMTVTFSPDGKTMAAADWGGAVNLMDVATGRVRTVQLDTNGINTIAFSPDGTMLNTVDWADNDRLFDTATFHQIGSTYTTPWADIDVNSGLGQHDGVSIFAPDGSRVYSTDETGQIWVLPTSLSLWQHDACAIANFATCRS
ncbi:MAG: WD40 repeat domain-containing protein, partial [Mycobacteriales bacterium]